MLVDIQALVTQSFMAVPRRTVDGMQNLPAAFIDTGSVDLVNGRLPEN